MKKPLKICFFLILLLLITGFIFFPRQILLACVKWQTASYCRKAFGSDFSYESLTWENGQVMIREGKMINPGHFSTTFSKATLIPSFDFKLLTVKGVLKIFDLQIIHQKKALPRPSSLSPFRIPFLTIQLETEIQRGSVLFSEDGGFHFDLTHQMNGQRVSGDISLRGESSSTDLVARFEKTDQGCFKLTPEFRSYSFPQLAGLVTYFFHHSLPHGVEHWHFSQGVIDGKIDICFFNGEPQEMKGQLAFKDIQGENLFLGLHGEIDRFEALLDIDFRSVETINGEFLLQGGRCAFQESERLWGGIWDLSHLQSKISLKEGQLEATSLQGSLLGMEGEVILDWQSDDVLMAMGFHGSSKEMATLLPDAFQEKFSVAFPNDYFALQAKLKRMREGLQLEGDLSIAACEGETYHLDFGCLLGKSQKMQAGLIPDLPFSLSRSVDHFLENLRDQFCLSRKRLGWFSGKGFPLEKFFVPFFLHGLPLEVHGKADFDGTFDERYLVIFYEGDRFLLDSPSFALQAQQNNEILSAGVAAVHYIDLESWDHVGFLPIKKGIYHQKKHDFFLTDADAIVQFENNKIHVKEITAYFNQLCLKGNVEIGIRSFEDLDLDLCAQSISGPAEDAERLLKHFVSSPFFDFPIKGSVESLSEALFFRYHFHPNAQLVLGRVQGQLVDCTFCNPLGEIENLNARIKYDVGLNQLSIESGKWDLSTSLGKSACHVSAPMIVFSQFPIFQVAFQVDVSDQKGEELITLSGKTAAISEGREITCEGFCSYLREKIVLKACQKGNQVNLADCYVGTGKVEGVLLLEKDWIALDSFRWTNSDDIFYFSGAYDRFHQKLKGEVSAFKWDLTTSFNQWLALWHPKGFLQGAATVEWSPRTGFKGSCKASFQDLSFGGIQFGSGEDLRCGYSSKEGLSVEGLAVEIPMGDETERYKLGRFHYSAAEQKITFEELVFSLPSAKIAWAAQALSKLSPNNLAGDWIEAVQQEEALEGTLSLEIYPSAIWVCLRLKDGLYRFGDHSLNLKDFLLTYDPYELNIWARYCHNQVSPFWLHFVGDSPTLSHGRLTISEKELSNENQAGCGALFVNWKKDPQTGVSLTAIEGSFKGLDISLREKEIEDQKGFVHLAGRIGCNPKQVAPLFAAGWATLMERVSLAGYYTIEGEWIFSKADWSDATFWGVLSGRDLNIGGVEFDNCCADCSYQRGRFTCSNLSIKDWAGRICVDRALLEKNENKWSLAINQFHIDEMRLSRLRSPWTQWEARDRPFYRSFYIRSFLLNDFHVNLGEMKSAVGHGKLEFTNLPKKTIISNLLLLPTEITARIGLDLTTLIPVKGTITYTIEKEKVYFNEFQEMYSDGKRSRFYLAEGVPAYIDFQGNLLLNVKMKQYNLLMKLAEFFTINVKGPLLNPSYTFSRQFETEESLGAS